VGHHAPDFPFLYVEVSLGPELPFLLLHAEHDQLPGHDADDEGLVLSRLGTIHHEEVIGLDGIISDGITLDSHEERRRRVMHDVTIEIQGLFNGISGYWKAHGVCPPLP
jgi:hypothetical protein